MVIQVTPFKKKRGGQSKHWAEEARVWTWYRYIKSRCDLSDYALDKLFAWTAENMQNEMSTDDRPRTFEWIRKKARKPRGIKNKWRTMDHLVDAVDQDERFHGSKTLYHSYFWTLLQKTTHSIKEISSQFESLLQEYQLVRVNPDISPVLCVLFDKYGKQSVFDRCLSLSIKQMNQISGITLVWLINLMARSPQTRYIGETTEYIFDKNVDDFFGVYFRDKLHFEYYTNAIEIFINARIDGLSADVAGYGYTEVMSEWPILPKDMVKDLSEKTIYFTIF